MSKQLRLAEIQQIEYSILLKFGVFCKKYDMRFLLNWGTLLGAVRHKGFIPWDDDIDVVMYVDDYKKLCSMKDVFDRDMAKYGLAMKLPSDTKEGMYSWGCRIYDTRTAYIDEKGLFSPGVCIDVSFYQEAPNNVLFCNLYSFKQKILLNLHYIRVSIDKIPKKWWKRCVKSVLRPIFLVVREDFFYNQIVLQHVRYSKKSQYVWDPLALLEGIKCDRLLWKREWFEDIEMLDFEGERFEVPGGYHDILTTYYGDYMKLPPVSQRKQNHLHGGVVFKE